MRIKMDLNIRLQSLFLVAFLAAPALSRAALPVMVANLNTTPSAGIAANPFVVNGIGYFTASDGTHGNELWRTDGTSAGTSMVLDINPGQCSSNPSNMTAINGLLYFTATTAASGSEPWVSDGTAAGTSMIADINPGTGGSSPSGYASMGGYVYFQATTPSYGSELWRTDGTTAGTTLVDDITPGTLGSVPSNLTAVNNQLFFSDTNFTVGTELWVSDGTSAGTSLVKDINSGSFFQSSNPSQLTAFGGKVYFQANDGIHGTELWVSDGTTAGTSMVSDIVPGSNSSLPGSQTGFVPFNSKLYFDVSGSGLWTTDGTSAGTSLVSSATIYVYKIVPFNGALYFQSINGLYKTDGTTAGTSLVSSTSSNQLTASLGGLFFSSTYLYTSDGTGAGTSQVSGSVSVTGAGPVAFGSKALFVGSDANNQGQPWVSNGTSAGTSVLASISPGDGSTAFGTAVGTFYNAKDYDNRFYFVANSGIYVSDDTASGTGLFLDNVTARGPFQVANNYLFYPDYNGNLWRTDGTPGGTYELASGFPGEGLGGQVFFGNGSQLWTSDGTPAGTHIFTSGPSSPKGFKRVGNWVYFFTDDGVTGVQLWKTDGIPADTQMLSTVAPTGNTYVGNLTPGGGRVFFQGWDSTHGQELWTSDGTSAGTSMVADIYPGTSGCFTNGFYAADFDNALYFGASDGTHGDELWASDGTSAGTSMVKDIYPGSNSGLPFYLTVSNGILYFNANDGTNGQELWESNGTSAGTSMVLNINPTPGVGSNPLNLIDAGGRFYFTAGTVLWTSDGTSAGTTMADNDFCNGQGSSPSNLYYVNSTGTLYMDGSDGIHGTELFSLSSPPLVTPTATLTPTPTVAGTRTPAPTPTPGPGGIAGNVVVDGIVQTVVDYGGVIYFGGQFTHAGPRAGQGVPISASTGLLPGYYGRVAGGYVHCSVPDGSGGWYIGGNFTCVNGQPCQSLGHVLWDGTLDPDWKPGADNNGVYSMALSGNTLYISGPFLNIGASSRKYLAAVDATTGAVLSWNPNVSYSDGAPTQILLSGNTLYVAGTFTQIGGQARNNVAALNATTGAVLSWNPNPDGVVNAMALSGSNLYLGGGFSNVGGQPRSRLAAVDATSAAVQSWNPTANIYVNSLAAVGSNLYVGGSFTTIGGLPRSNLASVDLTSGALNSWNPNPNSVIYCLASSGTTLYAGGLFTGVGSGPTARNNLAAWDTGTGNLLSWDPESDGGVHSLTYSSGSLFAGGDFSSMNVVVRNHLAAVNAATGALTNWNPNADYPVFTLLPDPASSVMYVAGQFRYIGGVYLQGLAALDLTTGSALSSWFPNPTGGVGSIAKLGNTLYVCGASRLYGLTAYPSAASATGWAPTCNGGVSELAASGGNLYAMGTFTTIGGQAVNNLAMLDPIAGGALSWNPNANGTVNNFVFNGNTMYVSGTFTTIGGQSRPGLAAVDATTGSVQSWNPVGGAVSPPVYSNGVLYCGPTAYDATTGSLLPWSPKPNGAIGSLDVVSGKVFLGGMFTTLDCDTSEYFGSVLAYTVASTPTVTMTPTITATPTITRTPSASPTGTLPTSTPTLTLSPTFSPTLTPTPSATLTVTLSPTQTLSPTFTNGPFNTATMFYYETQTATFAVTPSSTPTLTPSPTTTSSPIPPSCCSIVWSQTAGTLSSARGIAIDYNRNVGYVADGATIRSFNLATGALTGTVGALGAWGTPQGIWVGPDGDLYVANYTQADIQKVDPVSGSVLATIGVGDGLGAVRGVFVDPSGDLYVASGANTNNLFRYVYTAPNSYNLVTLSLAVTLSTPTGVARSGKNLFICDSLNNRVVMLKESVTGSNNYDQSTVLSGNSIPLNVPQELTEDLAGNICVADYSNQAFAVWGPTGNFLYNCQSSSYGSPFGIGVDAQGNLYLADAGNQDVVKVNGGCLTEPLYPTWTPTPTGTWYTSTPTATPSITATSSVTKTPTSTPTLTPTLVNSPTGTSTSTSTPVGTATSTTTLTTTNSPTVTASPTYTPTASPTQAVITVNPGTATPCSCPQSPGATNVTVVIIVLDNTSSTTINLTNVTIVDTGTGNPATGITGITLYGNGSSMGTTVFSGGSATFNINYNITVSASVTLTVEASFSSSVSVGSTYQFTVSGITGSNGQAVNFSGLPYSGATITITSPTPIPTSSANQASAGQVFLYPAPATGSTATLAYYMAQAGTARIRVWNETAELVAVLNDSNKGPGPQTSVLNLAGFSSGVYIYKVDLQYLGGTAESLAPQQFVVIR